MNDPLRNDRPAKIYFGPFAFFQYLSDRNKHDPNFGSNYLRTVLIIVSVFVGGAVLFVGCVSAIVFGGFFTMFGFIKSVETRHKMERQAQQQAAQQVQEQQPHKPAEQVQPQLEFKPKPAEAEKPATPPRDNQLRDRLAEIKRLKDEESETRRNLRNLFNALNADTFPVTVNGKTFSDKQAVQFEVSRLQDEQKIIRSKMQSALRAARN